MFVTQSTLSQQIRQLEEEMGVSLFDRDSHSVSLTESGEHLLPYAKRTLQDAESCFTQISDLKSMLAGTLNIGITYTFAPVLAETVSAFIKEYPGVKLNIICNTMGGLMELLKHREVDFVLSFKPTVTDDEIESKFLFNNKLSVILKKDHPLADKESFTIGDLMPHRIALLAKETQARSAFDHTFPGQSEKLNVQVEINEVNVLLDLIRATNMLTILAEATLYQEEGLKAIPLDAPDTQMEGCVHTLKRAWRKRAADEFIRLLSSSNAVMERVHNWLR